jgi:hypothetical protein
MAALEQFLHGKPVDVPPLLKAGIAHVQFETIHPFLDGNRVYSYETHLQILSEGTESL